MRRVDYFLQWQVLPFSSGHTPLPSGPAQPQSLHSFAATWAGGVLLALPAVNVHRSTIKGIVKTFFMVTSFCFYIVFDDGCGLESGGISATANP
jgi:hypothetical protein